MVDHKINKKLEMTARCGAVKSLKGSPCLICFRGGRDRFGRGGWGRFGQHGILLTLGQWQKVIKGLDVVNRNVIKAQKLETAERLGTAQ